MIDMFSLFTLGCFITNKKTETVNDRIMQNWVGEGTESFKRFLADEVNLQIQSSAVCAKNVHFFHTATENSRLNKLYQRNHVIVDQVLEKNIEAHPKIPLQTALSWALNKKKCLQMRCGFSFTN